MLSPVVVSLDFGPPLAAGESARLWFRGVPHAAISHSVQVYVGPIEGGAESRAMDLGEDLGEDLADESVAHPDDEAFAGSFAVYGHGPSVARPVHPHPDGGPGFGGLRPFDTVVDLTRTARVMALEGRIELTLVSVATVEGETPPPPRFARLELQRRAAKRSR